MSTAPHSTYEHHKESVEVVICGPTRGSVDVFEPLFGGGCFDQVDDLFVFAVHLAMDLFRQEMRAALVV